MKYLHLTISILILSISSCFKKTISEPNYCEMLELDQSYVDHSLTDEKLKKENAEKRKKIFINNFDIIINYTKEKGFPSSSFDLLPLDSCKFWATSTTFIHMAQANPYTFFDDKNVSLFKKELELGNINPENLAPAFQVSFLTNTFCKDLQPKINNALNQWELNNIVNRTPRYKDCN